MSAPALLIATNHACMPVVDSCCRRHITDSCGSLCTTLPHLGHLALSAAAAPDLLGALASLSGLRHLEVAKCSRVSDVSLSPSKYLTALQSLNLRGLKKVSLSGYLRTVLCRNRFTGFALQAKHTALHTGHSYRLQQHRAGASAHLPHHQLSCM